MCKQANETICHLFIYSSYGNMGWEEVEILTCYSGVWHGNSVEEALKDWLENIAFKSSSDLSRGFVGNLVSSSLRIVIPQF